MRIAPPAPAGSQASSADEHAHAGHDHAHAHSEDAVLPSALIGASGSAHNHDQEGEFIFRNEAQAARLRDHYGVVRQSGSLLWPKNYPQIDRNLLAGRADLSTSTSFLVAKDESTMPVMMLDGADELAQVLVSTGLQKNLLAAIQAFLIFPTFMIPTKAGYKAAVSGTGEALEARRDLESLRVHTWKELLDAVERMTELAEARERVLQALGEDAPSDRGAVTGDLRRAFSAAERARDGMLPGDGGPATSADLRSALGRLRGKAPYAKAAREILARVDPGTLDDPAAFGACVEKLNALQRAQDALFAAKIQVASSTLATAGTAGMWWAMAFFEVAALSQLAHLGAMSAALEAVGSYVIPFGQITMAAYGALSAADGVRVEAYLRGLKSLLRRNEARLGAETARTIGAELAQLRGLNATGNIAGGVALLAGQTAMFVGGTLNIIGLPLTGAGAVGTIAGIGARIGADLLRSARFGYDPKTIDLKAIAAKVDEASRRTGQDRVGLWLDALERERSRAMDGLVWLKLLKTARRLGLSRATGPDMLPRRLAEAQARLYRRGYQDPLAQRAQAILGDPEDVALLDELFRPGAEPMTGAFAALRISERLREGPWSSDLRREVLAEARAFAALPPAKRLGALDTALTRAHLEGEVFKQVTDRVILRRVRSQGRYLPCFDTDRVREKRSYEVPLPLPWLKQTEEGRKLTVLRPRIPLGFKGKTVYMMNLDRVIAGLRQPAGPEAEEMTGLFVSGAWKALTETAKYRTRSRKFGAEIAMLHMLGLAELTEAIREPRVLRD